MDSIYRETILDHTKNPRNFGQLDPADFTAEDTNPLCGDQIRMDLRVEDGVVADVKFSGRGCAVSMASASILTELVLGRPLNEVRALTRDDLLEEIGIPVSPARLKCALLGLNVLNLSLAIGDAHPDVGQPHEHVEEPNTEHADAARADRAAEPAVASR